MIQNERSQVLRRWLAVALWLVIIAVESTEIMSAQHTLVVLARVLESLIGPLSATTLDLGNFMLRKSGHFIGYGILGVLCLRAWRAFMPARLSRCVLLATMMTALVASLDEWHQAFLPGRTSAFKDVLLDTAGAVIMQTVVLAIAWRRTQSRAQRVTSIVVEGDPAAVTQKAA